MCSRPSTLQARPGPGEAGDERRATGRRRGWPGLPARNVLDLGHRRSRQQLDDPLDDLVDRSGRWCRPRPRPSASRSGPSARLMSRRSRSAIDAATSSTSPPSSATRRSARTRGDAVRYSFSAASGNTTDADVAALDHPAAALLGPCPLAGAQLVAHRRVGGDRADGLGDLAAADLAVASSPSTSTPVVVDRRARAPGQRRRPRRRR